MMKTLVTVWILTMALQAVANTSQLQGDLSTIQSVWPGAYYLIDEQNAYQASQILSDPPFHLQTSPTPPNLGFIDGQVWVWFEVKTPQPQGMYLQLAFAHVQSANVYVFSSTGERYQYAENFAFDPFSNLVLPDQFPGIQLDPISANSTIVLQVSSKHGLRLPINISNQKTFKQSQIERMAIIFISLGALLALISYNFILFLSTRHVHYLYYCLNLGFIVGFFLIDLGFTRYFYPADHWINQPQSWAISVCLAFIFAILFAQSFLRLASHYPKWNKWFFALIVLVLLNMAMLFIVNTKTSLALYLLVSGLYQLSVLIIAIIALKDGYKPARFFLMAWLFLAVGGFIYQLTIAGSISINLFTEHAFLIGTVIEAILLSWALADLINQLQTDQINNERRYQDILHKTGQRLSSALNTAEKHKKVRDVFLKHISHELKTPLNAIQHVLELSLQGFHPSSELIHDANHSTRLISRHIDKLLMNTELSSSEPKFEKEIVDIKSVLKNWNDDFYYECQAKNTEFSLVSNLVDWDEFEGPVRPIYLLLTEIVYKASELDFSSLILSLNYQNQQDSLHVQMDIHNRGENIIQDKLGVIQSINDLEFVEQVIKLIGGSWHVKNNYPELTVEMTIPDISMRRIQLGDTLPKTVLVIEDNEINQKVMASMLTRMGVDFEIAINGQEGLKKQARMLAPVILLDCQMPIMDGFETCSAIRQNVQKYGNPKIIAVSANSMEMDKTRCIAVGMNDFIAKPVRMEELRSALLR